MARAGAFLLLIAHIFGQTPPPIPPAPLAKTYYFTTADYTTNWQVSLWGTELIWQDVRGTNGWPSQVTVGWDATPTAAGYTLYMGRASRNYTRMFDAGTSNFYTVSLIGPPSPPLNHYLKVSWKGTNITGSWDLNRGWFPLGYTNNTFTLTNPPGASVYWQATNITITNWYGP